jgi:hypothetical protein
VAHGTAAVTLSRLGMSVTLVEPKLRISMTNWVLVTEETSLNAILGGSEGGGANSLVAGFHLSFFLLRHC